MKLIGRHDVHLMLVVMALASCDAITYAAEGDQSERNQLVGAVSDAEDLITQSRAASRLLTTVAPSEIGILLVHPDPSVSLRAAWRRETILSTAEFLRANRVTGTATLARDGLEYFAGFFEGRLSRSPPAEWMSTVREAKFQADGTTFYDCDRDSPYELNKDMNLYCPKDWILHGDAGSFVISTIEDEIVLRGDAASGFYRAAGDRVTALADRQSQRCVVFRHRGAPSGTLLCVSKVKPEEIKWRKDLILYDGGFSGDDHMWCHFEQWGAQYVLFYVHSSAVGIVAFTSDGDVEWSFNSDF